MWEILEAKQDTTSFGMCRQQRAGQGAGGGPCWRLGDRPAGPPAPLPGSKHHLRGKDEPLEGSWGVMGAHMHLKKPIWQGRRLGDREEAAGLIQDGGARPEPGRCRDPEMGSGSKRHVRRGARSLAAASATRETGVEEHWTSDPRHHAGSRTH